MSELEAWIVLVEAHWLHKIYTGRNKVHYLQVSRGQDKVLQLKIYFYSGVSL